MDAGPQFLWERSALCPMTSSWAVVDSTSRKERKSATNDEADEEAHTESAENALSWVFANVVLG